MSAVSSTSGASSSQSQQASQASSTDPFNSLNTNTFIQLLVTEMENQDPMNPMSNSDILQEIGEIRSVDATTQLTTTLNSVLAGQSVATASSLIGRNINGMDAQGNTVSGTVSSVSLANGTATLSVGSQSVPLSNVTQILPQQ